MKAINANFIALAGVALSFAIMYTYAESITLVYGALVVLLALICYVLFINRINYTDEMSRNLMGVLLLFVALNSILNVQVKSPLLMSTSLILPLALSTLELKLSDDGRELLPAFLLSLVIIAAEAALELMGEVNSNTFGFFCYTSLSLGFIWLKAGKLHIFGIALMLLGFYLSLQTGSRNVAIVMLLCMILVVLPKKLLARKLVLRVLYISVLVYTLFAAVIMEWGFANEELHDWLVEFTSRFSNKAWDMEGRIVFFHDVQRKIGEMGLYQKLFGEGILDHHGHNMFYQSVFVYGYVGTVLIYAFFVRIFELAIRLVTQCNDMLAYGCFLALLGNLMLNGADLYLLGTETCQVTPQIVMGLILYRYRVKLAQPPRALFRWGSKHENS